MGISALIYRDKAGQYEYFQKQLETFVVPSIILEGNVYEIRDTLVFQNGEQMSLLKSVPVLRTAYYIVLNRLDPIFALEGTDPILFKESVENLEHSLDEYASLFGAAEERIVRTGLYPLNFLASVANLEKARQQMLQYPGLESVHSYNRELKRTLKVYRKEIKTAKHIFLNFRGYRENQEYNGTKNNSVSFYFFSGYTNIDLLYNFFFRLEEYALTQEKKRAERQLCLTGFISYCIDLTDILKKTSKESPTDTPIVSKNALEIRDILSLYNNTTAGEKSPIVIFPDSKCFPEFSPVYFDAQKIKTDSSKDIFELTLLNDIYFYDARNARGPYLNLLKDAGADFLYQPVTNMYLCPDMAEYMTDASTILGVYALLLKNPLFKNKELHYEEMGTLAFFENKIAGGEVLYKPDIDFFMGMLSEFVSTHGEKALLSIFSREEILSIEQMLLLSKARSHNMDGLINAIVEQNVIVKELKETGSPLSAESLLISRGYPFITFFVFNNNFYGTAEDSFLTYEPKTKGNFDLVSYNNSLRNTFTLPEILKKMETGREIKRIFRERVNSKKN